MRPSIFKNRTVIAPLLVLAITLIVWGGVPWGSFQYDDFSNVVRDPATTNFAALCARLQQGLRPLTRLSYFGDAKLFGLHPAGFLATNLILHLITVVLVFSLARRRMEIIGAFIAALLFSLQPANAEVVAYVSGRSTGLMTPLLLGGLLLHDSGKRIPALVLFALASLAKEVALVFPALVLIWETTRVQNQASLRREFVGYLIGACAAFATLLCLANYRSMITYSFDLRSILDNVLANGRAIPVMLSFWVRPWALSPDHEFDPGDHIAASALGLALLTAILVTAFCLRRRHPSIALALAWPIIAVLPTNSIVPKIDLVTEKPLYLAWVGPSLAFGVAASALLVHASSQRIRRVVIIGMTIVICTMAGTALRRASLWRNPTLLWLDATAKAPHKSRCWNNLGMTYFAQGHDAEAVAAFKRAVHLDPGNEIAVSNLNRVRLLCGAPCSQY